MVRNCPTFEEVDNGGPLNGRQLTAPVITVNGGEITGTAANASGTVTELVPPAQTVIVEYGGCTAFTSASVSITPAATSSSTPMAQSTS